MEKLINRISKKQQQLNKEEVLELQRKSAEKRKEMKRAQELKKELDNKRTKRRRDERNYAAKEIAAMADLGAVAADLSVAEGASLDITV